MTVLQGTVGIGSNAPNEVLAVGVLNSLGYNTVGTITTYNNTSGSKKRIHSIVASGTGYAVYTVVLNTVVIATKRSGPGRNVEFFLNLDINDTDIIDIKAQHFTDGDTQNYEASILGF